jgi:hypothetical protein
MERNTKAVVDGYIACAIWADCPEEDQKHCVGPSSEFEAKAYADVADFLSLLSERGIDSSEWTDEQLGHDFWLTRQGHGTGFWDRGRAAGQILSDWARTYATKYCYVSDDGLFNAD